MVPRVHEIFPGLSGFYSSLSEDISQMLPWNFFSFIFLYCFRRSSRYFPTNCFWDFSQGFLKRFLPQLLQKSFLGLILKFLPGLIQKFFLGFLSEVFTIFIRFSKSPSRHFSLSSSHMEFLQKFSQEFHSGYFLKTLTEFLFQLRFLSDVLCVLFWTFSRDFWLLIVDITHGILPSTAFGGLFQDFFLLWFSRDFSYKFSRDNFQCSSQKPFWNYVKN